MGRTANDGRGRLGGRSKGTPNKPLAPITEWINEQLNRKRTFIEGQLQNPFNEMGVMLMAALVVAAAINEAVNQAAGQEPELDL